MLGMYRHLFWKKSITIIKYSSFCMKFVSLYESCSYILRQHSLGRVLILWLHLLVRKSFPILKRLKRSAHLGFVGWYGQVSLSLSLVLFFMGSHEHRFLNALVNLLELKRNLFSWLSLFRQGDRDCPIAKVFINLQYEISNPKLISI